MKSFEHHGKMVTRFLVSNYKQLFLVFECRNSMTWARLCGICRSRLELNTKVMLLH
jgi:hypothetical protein